MGASSMPCWTSYPLNLDLIVQSSERCDFRHDSLAGAATACEARKSCGGITRDEGLRCGPSGLKMPYEIRSGRTLQGGRPPASWLFHRHGHQTAECSKQPLDMRPNESPRELCKAPGACPEFDRLQWRAGRAGTSGPTRSSMSMWLMAAQGSAGLVIQGLARVATVSATAAHRSGTTSARSGHDA